MEFRGKNRLTGISDAFIDIPANLSGTPECESGTPECESGTPECESGTPENISGTPESVSDIPESVSDKSASASDKSAAAPGMYETHSDKRNLSAGKNISKNISSQRKKLYLCSHICVS
jgi:hypothetical protein